jgi:ABC-type multidrug transport system permease subunit
MNGKQRKNGNGNNSVEKLIDFAKMYAIVRKNWMVMKNDKIRLAMLLLFPMVMIVIFGYTAGEMPKHIASAIVDYDHSDYSQLVQSRLYSNELFSIKRLLGSQDEGRRLIESGEIKILFIIPNGFGEEIRSGRTAQLSVIVDEADPTVAQITRASTLAFVQRLSSEISAGRAAAISGEAIEARARLSSAGEAMSAVASADSSQQAAAADASFRDSRYVSSLTSSAVSSTVQGLRNSLGYVIDQSELLATVGVSDPGTVLYSLSAGDAQQAVLAQIAFYKGLSAANARLASDAASIYANSKAVYASALGTKEAILHSSALVGAAGDELEKISQDALQVVSPAVSMDEIQPYGSGRPALDFLIPSILALIIFQGAVMGLGRAVAGERRDGSLTRVFLTPTSNFTILSGTLLFYIVFEIIRSSFIVLIAMLLFGVSVKGSMLSVLGVICIYAAGATGLGMVFSVLARSQEQYMAMSMLITMPTMFLAGVFLPVETMPQALQGVAKALPMTYAADALRGIMIKGFTLWQVLPDLAFLSVFALLTIVLSLLLFKRELI